MILILFNFNTKLTAIADTNVVTTLHLGSSFLFVIYTFFKYYRSLKSIYFFVFCFFFSNVWFFFVFNWNISFLFVFVFSAVLLNSLMLVHKKKNSVAVWVIFLPIYLLNLKGDHNFYSVLIHFLNPEMAFVLKIIMLPISKLFIPVLFTLFIIQNYKKKHNFFSFNELFYFIFSDKQYLIRFKKCGKLFK